MACPFCFSDRHNQTGACSICLHPLKPSWISSPPHLLAPLVRLELVVADSRFILDWMAKLYSALDHTNPNDGWDEKYSLAMQEWGYIPYILEVWISEMSEIPPEPERAACTFLQQGPYSPKSTFIHELRKGNEWRLRVAMLSRIKASGEQVRVLQTEIVENTWWGLYGSISLRQQVLASLTEGFSRNQATEPITPSG